MKIRTLQPQPLGIEIKMYGDQYIVMIGHGPNKDFLCLSKFSIAISNKII